ncbi:structural protein [Pseudomonas phage vB_PaeS_PAO1_Ab18]|uniref:Virion structural protein n=1 Tax=Pseudomonas phage vB_PaeS_PAO1_Ab18 TaxID=1548905 RepID=A0A0A1IVS5_9CAUD|nr:structural protein [Pseudomonas phage vB_PaeS_PAO1_Ab18]CEF89705.1 hypothetical protein [Pseudomonas phage vB_PaeS_PAO1_Ab18]
MAYETGTSSSVVDLLDKFRLFAIAQGWSVNRWATAGSGRELCIQKGAAYFNFRAWNDETMLVNGSNGSRKYGITLNGSDGYSGSAAWDRQPGYPVRGSTSGGDQAHVLFPLVITTGPFPAYHFFAPDSKTLFAEVEISTGIFLRFGCGSLDLFNPAAPGGGRFCYSTGGNHVTDSTSSSSWLGSDADNQSYGMELVPFRGADYASNNSGYSFGSMVRAAFGSFDNWAGSGRTVTSSGLQMACQGGGVHDKVLRDYSPNPLNGIGLLLPNIVSLNIGDEFLSPIGVIPGMRFMDMTNYLPGDEFTIGSDVWKVFPWYSKGGIGYNRGIAYLKVA